MQPYACHIGSGHIGHRALVIPRCSNHDLCKASQNISLSSSITRVAMHDDRWPLAHLSITLCLAPLVARPFPIVWSKIPSVMLVTLVTTQSQSRSFQCPHIPIYLRHSSFGPFDHAKRLMHAPLWELYGIDEITDAPCRQPFDTPT